MPFLFALQVPVKRSYAFEQPEIPHGEQWVLKVCEGCAVVQVARCVYRRQDVYREVASYSKVCTGRYSKVCTARCVQAGGKKQQGVYSKVCTSRYSKV